LWRRLHRAVLDRLGAVGGLDWFRAVLDAASVRTQHHAWLLGYRRLHHRYERHANLFCTPSSPSPQLSPATSG
jgi:hypothetical protein